MGRSKNWIRVSFLHFERVEKFVEAVAYLTAFYYLLETNNIGNYLCDVSGIDPFNADGYRYQKQECLQINFPILASDWNCTLKNYADSQPSTLCHNMQQLAEECGFVVGHSSPLAPLYTVTILLGVSLGVLLVLIYFVADEETEEQKIERRYWSVHGCRTYAFQKLKMIRLVACFAQLILQVVMRIYYKVLSKREFCKNSAITTQTGLLYLWPIAIVATFCSAYPVGTPLGSPLHFRFCEGKYWKDTAEEEADAKAAMDALKQAQLTTQPWKRATARSAGANDVAMEDMGAHKA